MNYLHRICTKIIKELKMQKQSNRNRDRNNDVEVSGNWSELI